METLFPAQPLSETHQSAALTSTPENAADSSQPSAAGSKPHFLYKCLLNQLAQMLRKAPPVYQTRNEGSDHIPRFRSTVWVDGVSYTSSSTFKQRRVSEMDASKLAYIAITQKAKTDALHFIQEDISYCKSIMDEFAAKKNLGKPVYETTQPKVSVPVFCSRLLFNGGTYPGDMGKSKKEAERLVARSVIIRYLSSEYGNDMAFVVNCKLRRYHELNKVQGGQNGSNVLDAQTGVGHDFALTATGTSTIADSSAALESCLVQGTMVQTTFPSSGVHQSLIPQLSLEPITPVAPVVIQPPSPQVLTELINPVVTQPPTSCVSVESIKPAVAAPQVLTPVPSAVVDNPCTPVASASLVEMPAPFLSTNVIQLTKPEASPTSEVSVEPIETTVIEPQVFTPVPSAVVNNSCSPSKSAPLVEIPATNLSSNVIRKPKREVSPDLALECIPLVAPTSDKKRRRKSRKNTRKKMRADAPISVIPANQVLPFSPPQ